MKYPNIEAERARLNMKRGEMCDLLGVTIPTYRNWQLGKNQMPIDKAIALSKLLGKPLDYLFQEGDE